MIKNLLFDLGGVIMDIKRERAVRALEELGMSDAGSFLGEYGQKGAFGALERGQIDAEEFYRQVRPLFPAGVSDRQIQEAFDKFLIGIPVERLRALRELRSRYTVNMLSNTNEIMWESFILPEFRKDGHELEYYFDAVVTSFEVKAYKPEAEIFLKAQALCGIRPEETLFFDDSEENCRAAAALGFQTAWVKPGTSFMEYLG